MTSILIIKMNVSRGDSYSLWGTDHRPCDGGHIFSDRSSARCVEEDCSPIDRVPVPDITRNSRQCAGEQIDDDDETSKYF